MRGAPIRRRSQLEAIENARLFQELSESNATLKEALEQQTATAEVLRLVAASPDNVAQVLAGIAERTTRLTDDEAQWPAAMWTSLPDDRLRRAQSIERPPRAKSLDSPGSFTSRVLREGRPLRVADMSGPDGDPYAADSQRSARNTGSRWGRAPTATPRTRWPISR